jgi:hypothetical protein
MAYRLLLLFVWEYLPIAVGENTFHYESFIKSLRLRGSSLDLAGTCLDIT